MGCTTSQVNIVNSIDLTDYNFATLIDVMSYGGSTNLMNLEVEIYNALSTTRLSLIGDREINSLTADQRQQLLLVRFSANQNSTGSTIAINFVEYSTGRPVASFIGTSELGFSAAINAVAGKMRGVF